MEISLGVAEVVELNGLEVPETGVTVGGLYGEAELL